VYRQIQIGCENSSFHSAKGRAALEALCDMLYKSTYSTTTTTAAAAANGQHLITNTQHSCKRKCWIWAIIRQDLGSNKGSASGVPGGLVQS